MKNISNSDVEMWNKSVQWAVQAKPACKGYIHGKEQNSVVREFWNFLPIDSFPDS